jgi:hypothetical protein
MWKGSIRCEKRSTVVPLSFKCTSCSHLGAFQEFGVADGQVRRGLCRNRRGSRTATPWPPAYAIISRMGPPASSTRRMVRPNTLYSIFL